MLHDILAVFQVLLCISLIGLILIQHGKGADVGAAFGSGASGTVFGSHGSASFLTRITAVLATLFFLNSLTLAYFVGQRMEKASVVDQVRTPAPTPPKPSEVPSPSPSDLPPVTTPVNPKTGSQTPPVNTGTPATTPAAPVPAPATPSSTPAPAAPANTSTGTGTPATPTAPASTPTPVAPTTTSTPAPAAPVPATPTSTPAPVNTTPAPPAPNK